MPKTIISTTTNNSSSSTVKPFNVFNITTSIANAIITKTTTNPTDFVQKEKNERKNFIIDSSVILNFTTTTTPTTSTTASTNVLTYLNHVSSSSSVLSMAADDSSIFGESLVDGFFNATQNITQHAANNISTPGATSLDDIMAESIFGSTTTTAPTPTEPSVNSYFISMAWPKALIVAIIMILILVTVVGNTLVILAVLTTRRLRTVTNCFVMNLAITDWLVGTCVMPPSLIYYIVGSWRFGWILCDIWISLDVLLCTGSILSLCAISLDRYLAVTQPLTYSKKRRSKRLALLMIFVVWVTALSITCPPFLGWYEPGRRHQGNVSCRYNQNKGYVVFSAMGSFFIPLSVMLYVYVKIGYVLTSRRQRIVRDANSERTADHDIDCDNFISESEHFQCATPKFPSLKARWGGISGSPNGAANSNANGTGSGSVNSSKNNSLKCSKCNKNFVDKSNVVLKHQPTFYELVEVSRLSSLIHCSAISCKYGGTCLQHSNGGVVDVTIGDSRRPSAMPMQGLHYNDSQTSFSETCLASAAAKVSSAMPGSKQQQQHQHQHNHSHHHHHHPHHHHHRIPMRVSTTKRDTKTAKTLTIVMGGFIACWLPFFVYYLLIPFLPRSAVLESLMSFLTWFGWVNCAINPFIYAFYNPDFRTAFWRLTCRRICKQKPPPNHMAMFRN